MNHYTHFTLKEREILKHFIDIGKIKQEISIFTWENKIVYIKRNQKK